MCLLLPADWEKKPFLSLLVRIFKKWVGCSILFSPSRWPVAEATEATEGERDRGWKRPAPLDHAEESLPLGKREQPVPLFFSSTEDFYQNNFDPSWHHYHKVIENEGDLFNYVTWWEVVGRYLNWSQKSKRNWEIFWQIHIKPSRDPDISWWRSSSSQN